jgi:DNA-binding NarL/FixJ family response regulator
MKILSCDDHDLFRAGLRQVLEDLDQTPELLEAGDADEAFGVLGEHPDVDLVLLDLGLPGTSGLDALMHLRREHPFVPVVVISASDRVADIRACLDAGAAGFIPKSARRTVLLSALELVFAGGIYVPPALLRATQGETGEDERRQRAGLLTPRQREVLALMTKGLTNREIAEVLGIRAGTAKVHVAAILETLDVSNRTEAVAAAVELGLAGS